MGTEKAFTLIELIIVILIIGILAAAAAPLYLGYVRDAKMAEGKSHAGALWTSIQALGVAACGQPVAVSAAYQRAGFGVDGKTQDGRWTQAAPPGTITVDCATGAITSSASLIFSVAGAASDVVGIQVGLFYDAGKSPPSQLRCESNASVTDTSPTC